MSNPYAPPKAAVQDLSVAESGIALPIAAPVWARRFSIASSSW